MEEENVFYGKTEEEAIQNGLMALTLTRDEVEITVLEEGKKKLFGATKWKVRVAPKSSDGDRAVKFVDGLLKILGVNGSGELTDEEDAIKIEIKTENSARVIGKRGDVLDAIQCIAGAVANIGRDDYKKVVVDCENYRTQREETLVNLAHKVERKAVETGRKVTLEPMNPYERRIIHSALVGSEEVKTTSEGREPARYVVVIPNGANPSDRGIRYGERERGDRRDRRGGHGRDDRRGGRDRRDRGGRDRGERRDGRGGGRPSGGAKRGKKEIIFGTYLGNSGNKPEAETPAEDKSEE